jgi:nicotinic acid phosphoribosyltransferase
MEFGARRARGIDAAIEASKYAYIGGCSGTSNVYAGLKYNIPLLGTMAHSLVTEAEDEYSAFLEYAKSNPNNCIFLVDTDDTLRQGIPNAIKVAKDYLIPNGYKFKGIRIDSGDLAYLSKIDGFTPGFIEYLRNFKFSGDIYSVKEGTVVFPNEPLITVRANAVEAQIIETYLLLAINHQSLIATKTNRIVRAADGKVVMEFGARRAQGASASILGTRAAYIAGVNGTSCTYADVNYGIKAMGTMAHSWVQMFDTEYEAFKTYCEAYPNNVVL